MEHTNLPWTISASGRRIHKGGMGHPKTICHVDDPTSAESQANAAYIVKAANLYPEMVEALRGTVRAIEYLSGTTKHQTLYENAKAILRKIDH